MDTAQLTFGYYLREEAGARHPEVRRVVVRRWLCSCGGGGYALDATTFGNMVLDHLRDRHGSTTATVTGDVHHCTDQLILLIERKILG